jgi:hypothetical protein
MLLSYAAELQMMAAPEQVRDIVVSAGVRRFFGKDRLLGHILRRLRTKFSAAPNPLRVAMEFEILVARFKDLGVADPPDLVRGYIVPTTQLRRSGNPLEAASYLRLAALDFLLLHECGHIALNHFEGKPDPRSRQQREFEADGWAFSVSLRSTTDSNTMIASLLGAWLFLTTAERVDPLDQDHARSTHPSASERIARLHGFVNDTSLLEEETRTLARDSLFLMTERATWMRNNTADIRAFLEKTNTIERLLDLCVRDNKPEMFKDQLPRWILQGAPQRLCASLALARLRAETELTSRSDDRGTKIRFELVDWVYRAARESGSERLIACLNSASEVVFSKSANALG